MGVPLKFTAMYCSQVSPDCLKIGLKLKLLSEFEREQRKTLTTLWFKVSALASSYRCRINLKMDSLS